MLSVQKVRGTITSRHNLLCPRNRLKVELGHNELCPYEGRCRNINIAFFTIKRGNKYCGIFNKLKGFAIFIFCLKSIDF